MAANEHKGFLRVPHKILIVEDDAEVRCLLRREVLDRGHVVVDVGDAEQALGVLEEQSFAVVITDIRMPGMDGVELTRRIKQMAPDTEVVIITGYASIESASKAVRLGASDYLTKPFGDIDRIHESVERALEKHRLRTAQLRQLSSLMAQRESLAGLLDRLPIGVVLVDGEGQILLANKSAVTLLEQGDGLMAREGRLCADRADRTAELRDLIERTTKVTDGHQTRQGGAVALHRPSGRAPLSLLVTPLSVDCEPVPPGEPSTAIFVSDPEQRVETAEEMLCRLYALTPTEARLAAILMQGKSLEDAVSELEVSTNTVRTHLKRIFSKTSTTHQGDLISLLLSGPALFHGQGQR